MKILITGAAGAIGSTLVRGMKDRHELRGFDREPMPDLADSIVGDIADFDAVLKATDGMEAVIHLAACPGGGCSWEEILPNNIVGTSNLMEAAHQDGVRRVAYASRAGLLGPYPQDVQRTVDMLPRPETYYSVSKVFGESIGWMYSSNFGIEFVAVRIGNFNRARPLPEHPHHLSHDDAVRVFERAVVQPGAKYEVVFGVSDSTWPLYDVDHGREAIGFNPQDKSEIEPEI